MNFSLSTAMALAIATLSFAGIPAQAHHSPSSAQYVVGDGLSGPFGEGSIVCTTSNAPVTVGGACFLTPPSLPVVTIVVVDHVAGPVGFFWVGDTDPAMFPDCGVRGTGHGVEILELPPGCTHVSVSPFVGSTAGTIELL